MSGGRPTGVRPHRGLNRQARYCGEGERSRLLLKRTAHSNAGPPAASSSQVVKTLRYQVMSTPYAQRRESLAGFVWNCGG